MYRLFFLLPLVLLPAWISAQQKVINDTAKVSVRKFSPAAINSYKKDPAYQYDQLIEPPESAWDRFWEWFWGKIGAMLSSETGWAVFQTVLIVLASAILLFFVLKLSGMTNGGLFGKENKADKLGYLISDDDIHTVDFESAIEKAINDGNYRFAVRLLYLQSLKKLADLGLINWQINKTNVTYLRELYGNRLYDNFNNLTLQFENNWYGDVPIEENEFLQVKNQFVEFNQQLN